MTTRPQPQAGGTRRCLRLLAPGILATFNGHPHYEIVPTGQVFDGADEVMGYYRTSRAAFPDLRHGNVRCHVADDTIIVEFDLLGKPPSHHSRGPASRPP
jgi:hypothetical protein